MDTRIAICGISVDNLSSFECRVSAERLNDRINYCVCCWPVYLSISVFRTFSVINRNVFKQISYTLYMHVAFEMWSYADDHSQAAVSRRQNLNMKIGHACYEWEQELDFEITQFLDHRIRFGVTAAGWIGVFYSVAHDAWLWPNTRFCRALSTARVSIRIVSINSIRFVFFFPS